MTKRNDGMFMNNNSNFPTNNLKNVIHSFNLIENIAILISIMVGFIVIIFKLFVFYRFQSPFFRIANTKNSRELHEPL